MWTSFAVDFLTGRTEFNSELRIFGMAFVGAMAVRNGPNKEGQMNWFHAFALSTIMAFGGGWFGFMWMGKPSSLITGGDITLSACIVANLIVNATPFDIGYKMGRTLPAVIITTSLAQLFRCMGMVAFITTGFKEIKPTPYYPIPVLGPVLWGCLLGNMGGFFAKGFDGYLKNGIPWPFQNGIVAGTFFHLYAHDQDGPLGTFLRKAMHSIFGNFGGLDERTVAILFTSIFMQFAGIIMLPQFFGPGWSPIVRPMEIVAALLYKTPYGKMGYFLKDDGNSEKSVQKPSNIGVKKKRKRKKKTS